MVQTEITPSWIGGDGIFVMETGPDGTPILRRTFPSHTDSYSDVATTCMAVAAAARMGIAPPLVAYDTDERILVTALMDSPWRRARLNDLSDPSMLDLVVEQHRRFHEAAVALPRRDVVGEIAALREKCVAAGVVRRDLDFVLQAMTGFMAWPGRVSREPVPCHGDGAVSNVLVVPGKRPRLTGWTMAGLRDPLQEAGSLIAELSPFCASATHIIEILVDGVTDRETVLTAKAYAVLDDIKWALIGLLCSRISEESSIDYFKYGAWRLTKALTRLSEPHDVSEWLEELA